MPAPYNQKQVKRTFIPGDEWLYYKIYTGYKSGDQLLTSVIKPFCDSLLSRDLIDLWFFIRYEDPKPHLRIRFKCKSKESLGLILEELATILSKHIENRTIWKIQCDTYIRELERYNQYDFDASEQLFYADSSMVSDLLTYLQTSENTQDLRWLSCLRAVDTFLNTLGLTIDKKLGILEKMKEAFYQEFMVGKEQRKQLSTKYRNYKSSIESILQPIDTLPQEYAPVADIINQRDQHISGIVSTFKIEVKSPSDEHFVFSHIHMQLNRIFMSKNRLYELVLYDMLFLYYKSAIARMNKYI